MDKKISLWDFAKLGGPEKQLITDLTGMWAEHPEEFNVLCNSIKNFETEFKKVENGHVELGYENLCSDMNREIKEIRYYQNSENCGKNLGKAIGEVINLFNKQ